MRASAVALVLLVACAHAAVDPFFSPVLCGNGVLNEYEQCDDGNRLSGDGCSSMCLRVETGWTCPTVGVACTRLFSCGDRNVTATHETCDDGNTLPGDGCSALCRAEPGWVCPVAGSACTRAASVCGNGVVDDGEVCDVTAGTANSDACVACTSVAAKFVCMPASGGAVTGYCYPLNCTTPAVFPVAGAVKGDGDLHAPDCWGDCGGFARIDDCGVCSGGLSGRIPNADRDQCGVCFGHGAQLDACEVCSGGNSALDACGVCHGTNLTCMDCAGTVNGPMVVDSCGLCASSAWNAACIGCDGVAIRLGGKVTDVCGVCGGTHTNVTGCPRGCDGVLDSTAVTDCAGRCGGLSWLDPCNVCVEASTACATALAAAPAGTCAAAIGACMPLSACSIAGGTLTACNCTGGNYTDACGTCRNPSQTGVFRTSAAQCDFNCLGVLLPTVAPPGAARFDCNGTCGGALTVDPCGACAATGLNAHMLTCGCFLMPDRCDYCPTASLATVVDTCGICHGGNRARQECGVCFGTTQLLDSCSRCAGDSSFCLGCDGVPNSGLVDDACGLCNGTASSCPAPSSSSSTLLSALSSPRVLLVAAFAGAVLCLVLLALGIFFYRRRHKNIVRQYERKRAAELANAPRGDVTLVFTDIEGSTSLWENHSALMPAVIERHHAICRTLIAEFRGYEVKTEGDAFMIAFHTPAEAIQFCVNAQLAFLAEHWPAEILEHPACKEERDSRGVLVFQGLRVRMGVHSGQPKFKEDAKTMLVDYYGPMVNRAARVEHAASGGQVLISARSYELAREFLTDRRSGLVCKLLGEKQFRGISGTMSIWQVMPSEIAGRQFKDAHAAPEASAAKGGATGKPAADGARRSAFLQMYMNDDDDDEDEDDVDAANIFAFGDITRTGGAGGGSGTRGSGGAAKGGWGGGARVAPAPAQLSRGGQQPSPSRNAQAASAASKRPGGW